jgi:hypothetical protein
MALFGSISITHRLFCFRGWLGHLNSLPAGRWTIKAKDDQPISMVVPGVNGVRSGEPAAKNLIHDGDVMMLLPTADSVIYSLL